MRAKIESYGASTVPVLAELVSRVLGEGGLIALPAESFYGLAEAPFDEQALARLWQVKGRSEGKQILVLIGDESQLGPLIRSIPHAGRLLMKAFWPGPLTIVFPAAVGLSDTVTAGTGSVGVRFSPWEPLTNLLRLVGSMTGTSRIVTINRRPGLRKKSKTVKGTCWISSSMPVRPLGATVHRHRRTGSNPNRSRWSDRTRCHRGTVGRPWPVS